MKKFSALVLCVLVMLCAAGTAFAAKPGDVVTINLSVTNSNAATQAIIGFSLDEGLTYVSSSGANGFAAPESPNDAFSFIYMGFSPFQSGTFGSVKVKIDENATPGTYRINVSVWEALDIDGNEVHIGVSGGSVTVESAACTSHIWNNGKVETEATCAAEGVMRYTCTNSGCSATKTESIPKLTTHSYDGGKVTTEATCTKDGVKTYTCSVCKKTKDETIPATGHDDGEWIVITEATCKADGSQELQCTVCHAVLKTEAIPAGDVDHIPGEMLVTTEADCTNAGAKTQKCTLCGEVLATEEIPAEGHDDGEWVVVTAATCNTDGVKELRCTKCEAVLDTETILAAGVDHIPGEMIVTTEADCTNAGERTQKCTVCDAVLATEAIPAEGHDDGEWVVVTEATCEVDGLKELRCTKCEAILENETIPAANVDHIPGDMVITTAPTCTEPGEQTQSCTVCGEVLVTEEIPAEGHDEGKWFVVTPATDTEVGLQELRCTKCDAVLDSAEIPVNTTGYYVRNTVCSMGPRFKDESALTDKWYRFTPVDLSVDGVQTYELIGSDVNIIGYITVTVVDGTVTIDCSYVSDEVKVHSEFCTILPSLAETATLDQAQLRNYAFGEPISITDELGGDTKVLLFICNVVDYNTDMPITHIWPNTNDFMLKINTLKENMD